MLYRLLPHVKRSRTWERSIRDFVHLINIDKLLIMLRDSGFGCKIDNCYTGAISYADDITLSCPSIRVLNRMLDICNKFAAEHYLIFNSKKSLL